MNLVVDVLQRRIDPGPEMMLNSGVPAHFKNTNEGRIHPTIIVCLVPLTMCVNLLVLSLVTAYGVLNLLPDIPAAHQVHPPTYVVWAALLGVLLPTLASRLYVVPVLAWARHALRDSTIAQKRIPDAIARRVASAPPLLHVG